MRRVVALPLLALFSLALIEPAVYVSGGQSSVPECCRRDGKHRCALAGTGSEPGSGPVLEPERCPSFPAHAVAPRPSAGRIGIRQALVGGSEDRGAPHAKRENLLHFSFSR